VEDLRRNRRLRTGATQSGYRKQQILMNAAIPSHHKHEPAGKRTLIRAHLDRRLVRHNPAAADDGGSKRSAKAGLRGVRQHSRPSGIKTRIARELPEDHHITQTLGGSPANIDLEIWYHTTRAPVHSRFRTQGGDGCRHQRRRCPKGQPRRTNRRSRILQPKHLLTRCDRVFQQAQARWRRALPSCRQPLGISAATLERRLGQAVGGESGAQRRWRE